MNPTHEGCRQEIPQRVSSMKEDILHHLEENSNLDNGTTGNRVANMCSSKTIEV